MLAEPPATPPLLVGYDARQDGPWCARTSRPGQVSGVPEPGGPYRDVVVEAQVRLTHGDDQDAYGLFVRKAGAGPYLALAVTAGGTAWIRHFDGTGFQDVAVGPLAPGIPFDGGVGAVNLFQAVACGPGITFALNNHPVLAITVAPGLAEGDLGPFVAHGPGDGPAEVSVEWLQVRPVLAATPLG